MFNEEDLLCIYHGNCADGFGAAWVVWSQYPGAEFHAGTHGDPPPDVTDKHVVIVDFSYPVATLKEMGETAKTITVIDHHKSFAEELNQNYNPQDWAEGDYAPLKLVVDMEHSGAMLTWQYFNPGEAAPGLLYHIEDRDLWRFDLPGTKEIQTAVFSYEYDFGMWDRLIRKTPLPALKEQGLILHRKHMKDIKELVGVCYRRMNIAGRDVPSISLPYTMSSEAGHILAETEPFAACYFDTATHRCFSLRSADDGLDVSEIARQYGGGGHYHAAGFRVPRDHELAKA